MIENISERGKFQPFDMECHTGYTRITIDGKYVGCGRCVGYCDYDGHPGFLTEKLQKKHDCQEKECCYYFSKPRRERTGTKCENLFNDDAILKTAQNATEKYEGMRVIRIANYNGFSCVLRYATISNCYPIEEIENSLSSKLQISVKLEKINCDFKKAAYLVFSH